MNRGNALCLSKQEPELRKKTLTFILDNLGIHLTIGPIEVA